MKYREFLPHSSLQDYVKCFWLLEREYDSTDPYETVTPDAFIEMIFNFGTPYVLETPGLADREMPTAFIVGLLKKPLLFRSAGTVRIVSIRFHAWGLTPFMNLSGRSDGNLESRLDYEWQEVATRMRPRVIEFDYESAIALAEDFLITRLLSARFDLKEIQTAARMLQQRKGQFRISELAEQMNMSPRQLERNFQSIVGVSPKALARSIRFEQIRKRLMFKPDSNLTDLAYEFGYSDQAHFIRDFREFTDKTPSEFAAEMRALQTVFEDRENVVFLQFAEDAPE